jgi:aldehyde dehydrogenase
MLGGDLAGGYYVQPTVFAGQQQDAHLPGGNLRAGRLGDDLQGRGRGAGDRQRHALRPRRRRVEPRRQPAYRLGRGIQAGRVWTNCYHAYPAHAAFGGYKQSGIGRENHKMMLDHYQQTKNLLVSYSPKAWASSKSATATCGWARSAAARST